jgi:RNA polymerase sigma-70 factor (ECF subfamily)
MQPNNTQFPTTHWTLIARLKSDDAELSSKALDELCAQYHYPLYCYIRWRGLNHHDAQDALHDFLAKLVRLDALKTVNMEKGRLRSFLATALQRFLISRHHVQSVGPQSVSLDKSIEERFEQEGFTDLMTPEKVLERTWALTVLQVALQDTANAEAEAGRGEHFSIVKPFLSLEGPSVSYTLLAQTLGVSEVGARQAVKRLRDRFRQHLRKRVAETLDHPTQEEIDDELRALRGMMD